MKMDDGDDLEKFSETIQHHGVTYGTKEWSLAKSSHCLRG